MARLVRTALIITLRPGSVRTISEALRAASVASATAIPMSAFLSAGASLTPSPVIPQMCFLACRRLTISYLCSVQRNTIQTKMCDNTDQVSLTQGIRERPGKTPANPSAFSISSSMGRAAIDSSLFWPSKADEGYMFVPIPRRRPVSFPIANWSPEKQESFHQRDD